MKLAHIASIGFTLIFGFSYMFSKVALDYIEPMGLIAYRYLIAFATLEILRRINIIQLTFKKEHIKVLFWIVLFQPILYSILSIYGIALIASSEAIMMIALIPVFAGIFSAIILKETPSLLQIGFIVLSLSGVIYIQVSLQSVATDSSLLGFVLVLLSVICGAIYNVNSRKASQTIKAIEITYFMMLAGVVTFNTLYLIILAAQGEMVQYFTNWSNLELLVPVLYLGILSSLLAFFLLNYALSYLKAHIVGIYANMVTVIGIFAGYIILNEGLYYFHFIGSAMIIIGVYGTVLSNKKIRPIPKS